MEQLEKKLGAPRLIVALCIQNFKQALDFTFYCRLVELTDQAEKTGGTLALAQHIASLCTDLPPGESPRVVGTVVTWIRITEWILETQELDPTLKTNESFSSSWHDRLELWVRVFNLLIAQTPQ